MHSTMPFSYKLAVRLVVIISITAIALGSVLAYVFLMFIFFE
jgi:hypothetical protein